MNTTAGRIRLLPCLDSNERAARNKETLDLSHDKAAALGYSAMEATAKGYYSSKTGQKVDWNDTVQAACSAKISIPPTAGLPAIKHLSFPKTRIQVSNETTLEASQRLADNGLRPLALNFANGVNPGGGFLAGAKAQEEVLCRSSALYATLVGDPMYAEHRKRPLPDSTDWAILSPDVPVFRNDAGSPLDHPWLLSFLTSAAPYGPAIGQQMAGDLLQRRIHRVLEIARAYAFEAIVLGAWGCGAFGNDARRTALDFRQAIEQEYAGAFSDIVFAITDWSSERKFLGPFRDVFS